MENQHRKIVGYRELDEGEIELMNIIKQLGDIVDRLKERRKANDRTDQRWVAIGATDLQKGLMALTRSVAKPDFL